MRAGLMAVLGGMAVAGCSVLGIRSGTEQPRSETVARLQGGVEIRRYLARLAAETTVAGGDDWNARSAAFRRLADFIFGDNRSRAKIAMTAPVAVARPSETVAMTAPVETRAGAEGLTMRFFMPAAYTPATLPEPADPRVRIVTVPEETLAVLRFAGATGKAAVDARTAELRAALDRSAWRATGQPVALFYDPPWTLSFLRRNEVAVTVEPRA